MDQTKWVETSGMEWNGMECVSFSCSVSLFGGYVKYAFWLMSYLVSIMSSNIDICFELSGQI